MKKIKIWKKEDIVYLKHNYPLSDKEVMCKELNRSWTSIQAKALRLGIFRESRINLGKKNGQWKGGVNYDYYRRIAFENLPRLCAVCGSVKKLEVHHKDRNPKNNILNNLMILCKKCHVKVHQLMKGWARDYDACIVCNKTDVPHNAQGMCKICYSRVYETKRRKQKRTQRGTNGKYASGTRRNKRKC